MKIFVDTNVLIHSTIASYPLRQIHDANIVATILVHQIDTLLTLNVEDMKRFSSDIKIVSLTSEES
jgi:predicted nucleic acid-binding protein